MDQRGRIFVAEAVGTAILVIGGAGTAVFAAPDVGVLGVATAFGLSLLVLAYTIGPVSGCHVNPAVSLGMYVAGKLDAALLPVYWIAQLLGGLVGGALLWATYKISDKPTPEGFASNGFGDHSPSGFNLGSVAIIEILMTALLVLVVLGTTHRRFIAGFGGLAAGVALWLIHLISIPVSNTSVNPARSLGVAPFAGESWAIAQVWAFFLFPLVGAVVGALLWRAIAGSDEAQAEA